ncbi:hypothetical protein A5482_005305 [Cyanobacterium sp. IPPAS B-1200]|uniref:hypothetical protein n=1 Tax=Cyanobacterium sp. IPPAS B-1200 TaxID=1562720 RepID=UPI00085287A3|nr:hypothetical protein [Cyanobacterium sp. IPPAS B-1200]OEJ78715.1 hypothetical protein A5482_02245 [Cyanobacterium sp. IPPAS B-1200]
MLYLAQVVENNISQKLELHLLAKEESSNQWFFCNEEYALIPDDNKLCKWLLLLVEINEKGEIVRYRHAKDWVLNIIRDFINNGGGKSSDFLLEEQVRIEKWRQELTLESQDLTRLKLEMETRREELQQLEHNLSLERKKLND